MDLTELAGKLTTLLVAYGPTIEVPERPEESESSLARDVWQRLQSSLEAKPSAREAVADCWEQPDDIDLQTVLRVQLKKILVDAELAADLTRRVVAMDTEKSYSAQATAQGVIAQDGGVAAHMVAVGQNIHGNVTINVNAARMDPDKLLRAITPQTPEADLSRATGAYLDWLLDRYCYLDFRGMGISDRVPLRLPLLEMFVPLEARVGTPGGDTWARELRLAGREISQEEIRALGSGAGGSRPLLNLLRAHDGLIVLGDPGAGKTTFLKFLALSLATGQGEPLGLGTRLPVLVPLAAYATALAGRKTNLPLDRFINQYHQERGVKFPIDALLSQALEKGRALLLLDGLDEVKDPGQRRQVVDLVTDFFSVHHKVGQQDAGEEQASNKFVMTSRVVGYAEVRPQIAGLIDCTLVDLEDPQIEDFVSKWTTALERSARGQGGNALVEATREREELLSAIHRNPGVRALAVNPLLLTILALMKRQDLVLPERRVELYQKYIETLLKHWNLARSLDGRVGRDLDVIETLRILAPLALWMHRISPGVGLVPRAKLQRQLEKIYRTRGHQDPEKAAREFLEDVREHASLLLDRGGDQFGFIHLTFQEYLAGIALAQKGQQAIEPVVSALADHVGDATWHEVSLLAIGYLGIVQRRDEAAGAVLEALIGQAPGEPGEAVILAGEALIDVGSGGIAPASRQRVIEALLQTLRDDARVKVGRRATAGNVLAALGDPRFDADHWHLPDEPLLGFIEIPAGHFQMGNDLHRVSLPHYYLARWPVTVAQFAAFVRASGYEPTDRRSLKRIANHPVVDVTWHEAMAYCRWLNGQLQEVAHERRATGKLLSESEHRFWQGLANGALGVGLPSEAEWEKAARGGDGRIYPWGDPPDPQKANYSETGLNATSAVGCFPGGLSPYGCEEMSGNVWEWTRSLFADSPYPSAGAERQAREDPAAEGRRVLRGGAFSLDAWGARCAYRLRYSPGYRCAYYGVRVVVSPFFSDR